MSATASRLARLERLTQATGKAVFLVASDEDADRLAREHAKDGKPAPWCIVTKSARGRAPLAVGSVHAIMRDVAERGWHIVSGPRRALDELPETTN